MMAEVAGDLDALRREVLDGKDEADFVKFWAGRVLAINPRADVPDWVEAVANGNTECWASVLEVAREMIRAEGSEARANGWIAKVLRFFSGAMRPRKGQSLTEAALGLGLLALLLLALWVVVGPKLSEGFAMAVGSLDLSNGHPGEKHGFSTVERINKCLENNGPMMTFINRDTGRKAEVCKMENGKYAVRIVEQSSSGWRMVTAFVKEKLKTLSDVARYLGNQGYDPIQ